MVIAWLVLGAAAADEAPPPEAPPGPTDPASGLEPSPAAPDALPSGTEPSDPDGAVDRLPELEDPSTLPFSQVLSQAERWYFEGRSPEARTWLEALHVRLIAGEEPPWEQAVEALTYLGELQYELGEPESARLTFRWILERDPEAPISPYHHPLEAVNLFELERSRIRAERQEDQPPPPSPPPAPAWVWLPFGAPQLGQGRPVAAMVYGGLQVALAATSVATFSHLSDYNQEQPDPVPQQERDRHVQLLRYGVQWPATLAFYGTWATSSIDAGAWHRRQFRASLAVGPGASGGVALRIGGRL